MVESAIGEATAVIAWTARRDQGFRLRTAGKTAGCGGFFDGLTFVHFAAIRGSADPGDRGAFFGSVSLTIE